MEAMDAILNRRSVREYKDTPVEEDKVKKILEAAMSGPTCANTMDWEFIVVNDKDMLIKMADANGKPARPLKKATLGILVCGSIKRAFNNAKDYWIIDGAIAAQNIILAAEALGLGSVWLGTWPQMDRVKRQQELFGLPEDIVPHSIIALGYAASERTERESRYDEEKVHMGRW